MINTNLIIGRLGSGKTTCIKHLINSIPENEYWVIIVNEFGQVGIDSALLSNKQDNNLNVTEINGGCICCAAQSQLRVSLTSLIRKHRPDRIIIEATGLGHPAGIIDLLRDKFLQPIIKIDAIITLIDLTLFDLPFNAVDKSSPLSTESFNQQVQLADILVLNKKDITKDKHLKNAYEYIETVYPKKTKIILTSNGEIDLNNLTLSSTINKKVIPVMHSSTHYNSQSNNLSEHNISIESFTSETDEHMSFGYILPANLEFSRKRLQYLFEDYMDNTDFEILRLKAVFNCGKYWHTFNITKQSFDISESYYRRDNRIELITENKTLDINIFKDQLLSCTKSLNT